MSTSPARAGPKARRPPGNLGLERAAGADRTIDVSESPDALDACTAGKGYFDVLYECSGTARALAGGIPAMRPRGVVVQLGLGGDMTVPMMQVTAKELELRGSFRFHEEFATAVRLMQSGLIDVNPLITHTLPLDEAEFAFRIASDRSQAMKTQIAFARDFGQRLDTGAWLRPFPGPGRTHCLQIPSGAGRRPVRQPPIDERDSMSFFEAIEPIFRSYVLGNAPVKQIATGFDWTEGPVWFGDAGCLLFSDIPNDRIMRWTPGAGVSVYREPSHYANGHTRDREGRLISCEHGGRRVTRTEHDGSMSSTRSVPA